MKLNIENIEYSFLMMLSFIIWLGIAIMICVIAEFMDSFSRHLIFLFYVTFFPIFLIIANDK